MKSISIDREFYNLTYCMAFWPLMYVVNDVMYMLEKIRIELLDCSNLYGGNATLKINISCHLEKPPAATMGQY